MNDVEAMRRALDAARSARGSTAPNPPVGAVLVRDGVLLGAGQTQPAGGPHAEVMALRDARARGHDPRGATLFVTLEPCCHHGRTPPCTDAILEAGLARVVVGVVDPFPAMQGKGLAQLRAGGVAVELGLLAEGCEDAMRGFLRVYRGGLPEVHLKAATSLDGRIATATGASQWITGPQARAHAHAARSTFDALVVGIGTLLADDPRLTARGPDGRLHTDRQPVPVVLDTDLRTPADARLFAHPRRPVIVCADDAPARDDLAADVLRVPRGPGGLELVAAFRALGVHGLHRLLVEGGGGVHRGLLDAGLGDHLHLYLAPKVIPGGIPWVGGAPIDDLADAFRMRPAGEPTRLGDDVLLCFEREPSAAPPATARGPGGS